MGAEQEDTDPTPHPGDGDPGPSPKRSGNGAPDDDPAPVDFDALHAALGDLPPPTASAPPAPGKPIVGESQGRSSATYSSARPHTIPPTRPPVDDPHAPAVIVKTDETVPSAPPQHMTVPLAASPSGSHPAVGGSSPAPPPGIATPDPRVTTGQNAAAVAPGTPQVFTPQPLPAYRPPPQPTTRMPERPRRPRTPTVVLRPRGPSSVQKILVFVAMTLLFVGVGIAVIIWRRPTWFFGERPTPSAHHSASAAPPPPPQPSMATSPASALPSPPPPPTASQSSAPSASAPAAKPTVKKPLPKPTGESKPGGPTLF